MQIVLHIGTDKTGSTSIQNNVFANREWLSGHSIYLPTSGTGRGKGHEGLLGDLDAHKLEKLVAELRLASERGYQRALLSWEGMGSYRFSRQQVPKLARALGDFEIRIIVYLREQADIIQSGQLQLVKQDLSKLDIGAIEQPRGPVERIRAWVALRNRNRNYHRLLRRWQRGFPRAIFSLRIFERSQLYRGDAVEDFLSQLGVVRDESFVDARKDYNPSLDVEGALVLESLRKGHGGSADPKILLDVTQSVVSQEGTSTKYFLSEKTVVSIRKYFHHSNLKLASKFMPGGAYPFAVHSPCWRSDSMALIESRALALLAKVEALRRVPTLMGEATGEAIGSKVDLYSGWGRAASWGVWSTDRESRIRFRLYRHRLIQEVGCVRLRIEGRYYGNNAKTRVEVNGVDFGALALRPGGGNIELPVDALQDNEILEVVLRHEQPVSPAALEGKSDKRTLAFGIERLACSLVRLHDS